MEEDGILVGDHQVVGDAFPLEEGDDEWTDCDEDDALDDAEDGMSEDDELQPTDGEDDVDELGLGRRDMGEAAAEGEEAETYTAFEVLESAPLDHAFYGETTTTISPRVVAKEVRTLMKGLPQDGSIAIRGYEDRADLCRAVVFGPVGTPYAGVPFFFDIFLPADYPKSPPKMLYWAGTSRDRLNPNLYENGKVCLSLLGTWNGPGWDPKTSSILQLLLSVQALVLVDEPYFNEPGFEKLKGTAEGTRASKLYSENACVLSLQSLLSLWNHTPAGFKVGCWFYYVPTARLCLFAPTNHQCADLCVRCTTQRLST
jgi:ubiquitin-conjugating enzyme E2 O